MRDYRKIVAWQRGHALALRIYRATASFPGHEQQGITSQLRRAASSVPANIVEGAARSTKRDYVRYLGIALSSLKETEYFLLLSHDLSYIDTHAYEVLTAEMNQTFAALVGLQKAVRGEINES